MSFLTQAIEQRETKKQIRRALEEGITNLQIFGLPHQVYLHYASTFASKRGPLLILVADELEGRRIVARIKALTGLDARFYPATDLLVYRTLAHSQEAQWERLRLRFSLDKGEIQILVTTLAGWMERSIDKDRLLSSAFLLAKGQKADPMFLLGQLVNLGYDETDLVEGPGQYSHRGGLIDVFSLAYEHPIRIEFFDDEIEALRMFDIQTQKSIQKMDACQFLPARELLLLEDERKRGQQALEKQKKDSMATFAGPEYKAVRDRLQEEIEEDQHALKEALYSEGLERYLGLFYEKASSIADYFSAEPLIWTENLNRMLDEYAEEHQLMLESYQEAFEKGLVLPAYLDQLASPSDVTRRLQRSCCVHCTPLPLVQGPNKPGRILELNARQLNSYLGKTELFLQDLKRWVKQSTVVIFVENKHRKEMLVEEVSGFGYPFHIIKAGETYTKTLENGQIYIVSEVLDRGAELVEDQLILVGEKDIFSSSKETQKRKRPNKPSIRAFTEVSVGDYVVHDQHGVGQYLGITTIITDGLAKDYLDIQYAKEDKLFIPVEGLESLEKYVGAEGYHPRLSRLGSKDWDNVKQKVRQAVKEIAIDLLALYAKRAMSVGYAFDQDTVWQKEFEEQFPYRETKDQLQAIQDTKEDMESLRPMDRIIIGDVGYGKTEVALRAAFKAANHGKQVAILVPTTVLANQHYKTFEKRFADWPIKIAVLNRFVSSKDQKITLRRLREGQVDIIIGTHRLLSSDVLFHDLGLVIVDEEQRFGVGHKERLKEMRQEVDFLTLSATPIPRTLHMSLSGARDMSIIETPPDERHPVQTYVLEYSETLIERAIRKELARQGQVYFIHNRISQLPGLKRKLELLVPEAKIVMAHGQMDKRHLEQAMMSFVDGEADVLLCTTIVESGIDIANVNTLLVNDADAMGLSQIYQLKGRVGRSSRVAHAYFMYRKDKILKEEAEKRLKAIKEFTEFGAGFKIAMRDLEIRGAGNILGAEQHGHMLSVGFEMYRRLLDEEVQLLKGTVIEETQRETNPKIELKVNAHIAEDYIESPSFKMDLYSRLVKAQDTEQLKELEEEMHDRFGPLPRETKCLMDIAYIKLKGKSLGLHNLVSQADMVVLSFDAHAIGAESLLKAGERFKRDLLVQPKDELVVRLRKHSARDEEMLPAILDLLRIFEE